MITPIIALIVGIVVGAVFSSLKLPVPAPEALSGVLGIFGIYIGHKTVEYLIQNWDRITAFIQQIL